MIGFSSVNVEAAEVFYAAEYRQYVTYVFFLSQLSTHPRCWLDPTNEAWDKQRERERESVCVCVWWRANKVTRWRSV